MKFRKGRVVISVILCMAMMMPEIVLADEASFQAETAGSGEGYETVVEETTEETAIEETVVVETTAEETTTDKTVVNVVNVEESDTPQTETKVSETEESETEESETEEPNEKNGLVTEEDGTLSYYENGQKFTDGYKEVTDETGRTAYYYFTKDGSAYTNGYKRLKVDGQQYHFYFQKNGQAFTDGFLEFVHTNGKTYYFYFQENGRAFTEGYKGVSKRYYTDGKSDIVKTDDTTPAHYYFQKNGQAFKNGLLEFVHTNGKTYYFYFQENGQAYTNGYKCLNQRYYTDGTKNAEKVNDNTGYRYYFQKNGQAYTGGFLQFVHTNGKTYYFYFQKNGQAYAKGLKAISSGATADAKGTITKIKYTTKYYYYFQKNGQAIKNNWVTVNKNTYYFGGNGRAYTGLQTVDGTRYYFNTSTAVKEWKNRKYQNPSRYYQIQDSISLSGGGYNLSVGYEGLKTAYVIRKLGLGNAVGMGGAYYSKAVASAVKSFQSKHNLSATGVVDLKTWKKMGYTEKQWYRLGAYTSPVKVTPYSTKSDCIEIMISRAYDYLGDDYVIGASGAPGEGVDCSGLVMQALYAAGIDLSPINPVRHASPGYEYESRNIWTSSKFKHVSYSDRKRGDIIIYCSSSGTVIHSAIYLGNNKVIESWPNKVQVSSLIDSRHPYVKGVLRVFN